MGGSIIQPYIVKVTCDPEFAGQTITMSQAGQKTISKVCPSSAPYRVEFKPMYSGAWRISGQAGGSTFSEEVNLAFWGEYDVELSVFYDGATALPTNSVPVWLKCGGITGKSYTSISQVLADTNTLSALISNENAVKYMVRSTEWATSVCADQNAMTYIGLNDNCARSLLEDTTWLVSICSSSYYAKVLNVKVPTMTSNTNPSGTVSSGNVYDSSYAAYKAFDGSNSTYYSTAKASPLTWIGYRFATPTCVNRVSITQTDTTGSRLKKFVLQGSTDGTSFENIDTNKQFNTSKTTDYVSIKNNKKYTHYRVKFVENGGSSYYTYIPELQLYGRQ